MSSLVCIKVPAHQTACQGKQSWEAGETGRHCLGPLTGETPHSLQQQTSLQMDQGHSPRTLRGLGVKLAPHRLKARSGGNGIDRLLVLLQGLIWL